MALFYALRSLQNSDVLNLGGDPVSIVGILIDGDLVATVTATAAGKQLELVTIEGRVQPAAVASIPDSGGLYGLTPIGNTANATLVGAGGPPVDVFVVTISPPP